MKFVETTLAAILGALVGFVSAQIQQAITRRRERWVKHFNALVRLDFQLNQGLEVVNRNRFQSSKLTAALTSETPTVFWGGFQSLEIEQDILLDLLNSTLANRTFGLSQVLQKLNRDQETLMEAYLPLRHMILGGSGITSQYRRTASELSSGIVVIVGAFDMLSDEIIALLSTVRAQLSKDEPRSTYWPLSQKKSVDAPKELVVAQRAQLLKEIEKVREESKQRIDKYIPDKE